MRRTLTAAALLALGAQSASAHVMPAHQGTIAIRGRQLYMAVSLPARHFPAADLDGDGRISAAEVIAGQSVLQRLIATRVHLADGQRTARLEHVQVIVERLDTDSAAVPSPAADVLVLVVGALDEPPSSVTLTIDGLDDRLTVRAYRERATSATESITLQRGSTTARFFVAPWRRALIAAGQGIEHIAGGPDHLLFLLTLVLAGSGWRYWAAVISSFTVAHALVLATAAWGHAPPVPGAAAEVMIAFTILIMAVRVWYGGEPRLVREAALAAGCGFVHGLGVVDAVRALTSSGSADLVSLVAFNGGVEVAQLVAAAVFVAVMRVAYRALSGVTLAPRRRVAQFAAAGTGLAAMGWLVVRIPQL